MRLLQRAADIVTANLHEAADYFEDPVKMLKLSVRELETAIDDAMHQAVSALTAKKLRAKERGELEQQASNWDSRARKAIERGDPDRARLAVTRKLECERQAKQLSNDETQLDELVAGIRRRIERLKRHRQQAEQTLVAGSSHRGTSALLRRQPLHQATSKVEESAARRCSRLRESVESARWKSEAWDELSRLEASGDYRAEFDLEVDRELLRLTNLAT